MAPSLALILLALALVLPVLGALLLRLLASRLALNQLYGAAAAIFGIAVISVLVLARSQVPSLTIGGLSVLLPISAPADLAPLPPTSEPPPQEPAAPAVTAPTGPPTVTTPTRTAAPTRTAPPTATRTTTRTATPTSQPPTATSTAEPTVAPTAVPPTAAPARRTYIVQPGDTLRSIAEQFDVTVAALLEANRLTPQQADSLRIGQELVIP